jgi:hypothetical protein
VKVPAAAFRLIEIESVDSVLLELAWVSDPPPTLAMAHVEVKQMVPLDSVLPNWNVEDDRTLLLLKEMLSHKHLETLRKLASAAYNAGVRHHATGVVE